VVLVIGVVVRSVGCMKRESEFALSLSDFSSAVWELGYLINYSRES